MQRSRQTLLVTLMLVTGVLVGVPPTYGSAFPGANGRLAFTRVLAAGRHIYTVNPDGSGELDITPTGAEVYNDEAAISAEGTRIAFVSNRDYAPCCIGQDIYVMNIDGSGASRLTTTNDNRFPDRPTWSADGTKIAFVYANQIWTMSPDGTAQAPLTSDATYHDMPSWSPDGRKIAFVRRSQPGDTGSRIYVMNADGTGAYPVSSNSGLDAGPISWSPDGTLLAYGSARDGGGEIWLAAADGSGESSDAFVKCCRGPNIDAPGGGSPAWSPDGLHVAFEGDGLSSDPEYPKHSIFVVDSSGGGLRRLTHVNSDSSVNWAVSRLVDRTPPTTSASLAGTLGTNGWHTSSVLVTLSTSDGAGSGVAATFYAVDDPTCSPAALTTCHTYASPFSVATDGKHTVTFFSRDVAANVEGLTSVGFNIDTTLPTIGASVAPPPNADGWNNTPVTVNFACSDALSGIASCTGSHTFTSDGVGLKATGTAIDQAGNTASASASVNIDVTPPTITASATIADGRDYATGTWTNQSVTVRFQCVDALAGVAACPAATTLTSEGAMQEVSGSATDRAGNTAVSTFNGINIDRTPPRTVAALRAASGSNGWYTSSVTVVFAATDDLSGVASTTFSLDGTPQPYRGPFTISTDGLHFLSYFSQDVAGNIEAVQFKTITIDQIPPGPTRATLSAGVPGQNGWYLVSPTVSLSSYDATSSVAAIYYQFVRHGAIAPTQSLPGGWIAYATPFITPSADSDLYAFSVDFAGNTEALVSLGEFKVDGVRPTTIATLSGTLGNLGWFRSPVMVTLSATDDVSGVASIRYSVDNDQLQAYTGPFTIGTDGIHLLTLSSVDYAGNVVLPQRLTVKIDQTPPVTTISVLPGFFPPGVSPVGVAGTATVKSTTGSVLGSFSVQCWNSPGVNVAFSATDGAAGSGMATLMYAASGAQTVPSITAGSPTAGLSIAAAGVTTVTVAATDVAGNTEATRSESVIVFAGQSGTGFACGGPTPTSFALPAHGTLVVSGTVTVNGTSSSFTRTINF